MKVRAWKNIDFECEVDVSLDDCLDSMLAMADEDADKLPRRKLQAIDAATKVLEKITPDMIAEALRKNPVGIRDLIRERLQLWIEATKPA